MNVGFKSYATVGYPQDKFGATDVKNIIQTRLGSDYKGVDCYNNRLGDQVIVNHDAPAVFEETVLPVIKDIPDFYYVKYNPADDIKSRHARTQINQGNWVKL